MKKILSLILVVVALSLSACGGKTIIGTWKCKDYDITITFKKDGTAIYTEDGDKEKMEWLLVDDVVVLDGDETDLSYKDGQLIMDDGGEICAFVKK